VRKKKPYVASADEVTVTRRAEEAVIQYKDPSVLIVHLMLGPKVQDMTDAEILAVHNDIIRSRAKLASEYKHVAVEIPPGRPQIRYFARADQWVPRGAVLRCIVSDGGPDNQAVIYIDDRELSLQEFGRLLMTYAGWGMRLVFVPEEDIAMTPKIEVRDVEESGRDNELPLT
jgi:hypothetical protein